MLCCSSFPDHRQPRVLIDSNHKLVLLHLFIKIFHHFIITSGIYTILLKTESFDDGESFAVVLFLLILKNLHLTWQARLGNDPLMKKHWTVFSLVIQIWYIYVFLLIKKLYYDQVIWYCALQLVFKICRLFVILCETISVQ